MRRGGGGVAGVPARTVTLARIAAAARPGWYHARPPGIGPGLEQVHYFEPAAATWGYCATVALVEIDPDTGRVAVERLVVAHDCGVEVNPALVEGQMAGGAVQGLGGALLEAVVYDADGQLLTGSLMDYALPPAADVPAIELIALHTPPTLNPLGVKGTGEGGTITPPAAILNAVADAVRPFSIELHATPVKPEHLLFAIRAAC